MNSATINFHIFLLCCLTVQIRAHEVTGFDDTVLFNINWPGDQAEDLNVIDAEQIIVTSSHKEKYKCILPSIEEKEHNDPEKYEGPSPLELIAPLFSQKLCVYRLESYWAYEVCHGRYIKQYHEDREGKTVKKQEYMLGEWKEDYWKTFLAEELAKSKDANKNLEIPHKKIDGVNLPYFEIVMGNGTVCDLNQKYRETKFIYVCYIHGKHEVFSLKETSTCQYEIIILTPVLCSHPKYKPQESGENQITCIPLDGSPKKPRNLLKMQYESAKLRRRDVEHIRVEFLPLELSEKEVTPTKPPETPIDTSPVESFLSGNTFSEFLLYKNIFNLIVLPNFYLIKNCNFFLLPCENYTYLMCLCKLIIF